jgi:hypothetical protein
MLLFRRAEDAPAGHQDHHCGGPGARHEPRPTGVPVCGGAALALDVSQAFGELAISDPDNIHAHGPAPVLPAADPAAAAAEARRILRPGQRLVLTNWQPKTPRDTRLPGRIRINWPHLLRNAGFTEIELQARPGWHSLWTRILSRLRPHSEDPRIAHREPDWPPTAIAR